MIHDFSSYRPKQSPDQETADLQAREAELCAVADNVRQELGWIARRLVALQRTSNLMPGESREG